MGNEVKIETLHLLPLLDKMLAKRTIGKPGQKPVQMKPSHPIQQVLVSVNGCENIKISLLHLGYVLKRLSQNI